MSPAAADPAGPPPPSSTRSQGTEHRVLLRAARQERGWSQSEAARELSGLAARSGTAVAGAASLKTQLSRWENGHATPDPEYRVLLGSLYGRDPSDLGLVRAGARPAEPDPQDALAARLAEAAGLDDAALDLLRDQFQATARLDHRLGAAGSADALAAQVERLSALAEHVLPEPRRHAVHALLAEAALLAGAQERDRDRPERAWERFGRARASAREAGRDDLAARAVVGRAGLLLDAGRPTDARTLVGTAADPWSELVRAEAADDESWSPPAAPDRGELDAVRPAPGLELDLVHHRHAAARAGHDPPALAELERRSADEGRPVRERAEAQVALALALDRAGHGGQAREHAHRAHLLALRIGAPRLVDAVRPLTDAGPTGPPTPGG